MHDNEVYFFWSRNVSKSPRAQEAPWSWPLVELAGRETGRHSQPGQPSSLAM